MSKKQKKEEVSDFLKTSMSGETLILKSTGQHVFPSPWIALSRAPWPKGCVRIMRPFLNGEGAKNGNKGETMIVRKHKLITTRKAYAS